MNVRVGIDIDGVCADSFSLYRQIAEEEGVTDSFEHQYNGLWKVYTKDNEVFGNVLFNKHKHRLVEDVEPIEGALEAYKKFINNDYLTVYFVTSRDIQHRDKTKKWLNENGFDGYEDLFFFKDKLMSPAQVIIDDKPSTVKSFQEAVRMGLLVDAPYNQDAEGIHYRVNDLSDAYQRVIQFL